MFGSYFFSILLHLALALLIFLWPSSPPVKLDQPMMQISVNMGAPGGNRMASPVAALTELGICPAGEDIHVQLHGGVLTIRVLPGRQLLMTGAAETVCEGYTEV
mgnify:CR=1 FL=1